MKKILLTLVCFAVWASAFAEEGFRVDVGGIMYNLYPSPGGYDYETGIEIPATVGTASVTYYSSENEYAENGKYYSGDIVIPETFEYDGVKYTVTNINYAAFRYCSNLTSISLPSTLIYIESYAFQNCSSLESIVIPEGVTNLGYQAFFGCSSLKSVSLPKSLTNIEGCTFENCYQLKKITLAEGLETIGARWFAGLYSLQEINIPSSVNYIGSDAFEMCNNLSKVVISDLSAWFNIKFEDYASNPLGALCNMDPGMDRDEGCHLFLNDVELTDLVIPDGVTTIKDNLFRKCLSLQSVTIPSSVTKIGVSAFSGCKYLTEINFSEGLEKIGEGAFSGCENITSFVLPSTVKNFVPNFSGCKKLQEVTLNGVTEIPSSAFSGCSLLINITIPEGVTSIGYAAFYDCTSLTNITIPEGVTSIGERTFYNCVSLTNITIPEGVTSIGERAFYGCWNLPNITLPSSLKTIGQMAFGYCHNFTSITIPENVETVGLVPFLYCENLESVDIKSSQIDWAKKQSYSDNYWGSYISYYPCDENGVNSNNSNSFSYDSYEENGEQRYYYFSPFKYCSKISSITLAEGTTTIPNAFFVGCTELTSVNIPLSVKSFKPQFSGCKKLQEVTLNGVTEIPSSAFSGCTSLTNLTIPEGVTSIGYAAFYDCTSLTNLIIPEGVTSIGELAFYNCVSLTNLTIPEGVTSIGERAFYGCWNLPNIMLPSSLKTIGQMAFGYCHNFTSISIPENVETVGIAPFLYCENLESVDIKSSQIDWAKKQSYSGYYGDSYINYYPCDENGVNYSNSNSFSYDYSEENGEQRYYYFSPFKYCENLNVVKIPGYLNIPSGFLYDYYYNMHDDLRRVMNYPPDLQIVLPEGTKKDDVKPATIGKNAIGDIAVIIVPAYAVDKYREAWPDYKFRIVAEGYTDYNVVLKARKSDSDLLHKIKGDNSEATGDEKYEENISGNEAALNVLNLKIKGTINSYDIMIMNNKMLNLRNLDLSEADVVACPSYEYYQGYHTTDSILGGNSFYKKKTLRSVKTPNSVKRISYSAFNECINLKDVTIGDSITYIDGNAFANDTKLRNIQFNDTLQSIGNGAFRGCSSIEEIVLPEQLKTIESSAFEYCYSLKSIAFPPMLKTIEYYAFSNCSNLEKVELPTTLERIGGYAFSGCNSLKEVRIPESIEVIGDYAFQTNSIRDIYTWTIDPTNINQNTFHEDLYTKATLHVPATSEYLYYWDTQWSKFQTIFNFNEPYKYFYLTGRNDLEIGKSDDFNRPLIKGEEGENPDADFKQGSGFIVRGEDEQGLGNVNIESNGQGNSSSIIGEGTEGNGNITIEKLNFKISIEGNKWYFFAFPFDIEYGNIHFNGQFVWRYYDGEYRAEHGSGAWKNQTGKLERGKGYIFQASKSGTLTLTVENANFDGDDHMISLKGYPSANAQDASWNLVGNPFTSYYELRNLGYTAPITIWNANTNSYEAFNPADDDETLYPFQAFFVQKPTEVDGVTFAGDKQVTKNQINDNNNNQNPPMYAKPALQTRYLINLTITDGENSDKTRVVFNEEKKNEYEMECDAAKFLSTSAPQLYSLDNKNVKYAINERAMGSGEVRLGFTAQKAGTFTIKATRMDEPMLLKDLRTGIICDLNIDSYCFDAKAGTDDERFIIFPANGETGIDSVEAESATGEDGATYTGVNGVELGKNIPAGVVIEKKGDNTIKKVIR